MEKLQEIFDGNLHLLEHPAVKALIEYVTAQHKQNFKKNESLMMENFRVLDVFMHSELIVINGTPCKEALTKIGEILNENP